MVNGEELLTVFCSSIRHFRFRFRQPAGEETQHAHQPALAHGQAGLGEATLAQAVERAFIVQRE